MSFNNFLADGKANTGAWIFFGGVKALENGKDTREMSIDQGIKTEPKMTNFYWLKDKILQVQDNSNENNHLDWLQACEKQEKPVKTYPWQIDVCKQIIEQKSAG